MTGAAKRILLETLGWLLVLAGVAALVLPGPGLLCLAGGLAILSQQYTWAERLLDPVMLRALRAAAEGVETWPRVIMSTVFAFGIGVFGIIWLVDPDVPSWWPIADKWWLAGGMWTGITLLFSCALALALLVYSFRRFHGKPEARAALEGEIGEADSEAHEQRERMRQRLDDDSADDAEGPQRR